MHRQLQHLKKDNLRVQCTSQLKMSRQSVHKQVLLLVAFLQQHQEVQVGQGKPQVCSVMCDSAAVL